MQSMGIQMRISDLLFALQKRWKIIVSLTIVGFVFGMLLSAMSFIQSTYQSYSVEGSFIISSINSKDRFINGYDTMSDGDFHLAQSMVDTVLYMLTSDRLMNEVINDEELLGVPPEQLAQNLRLSQYLDTPVVEMKFTWNNADVGIRIWEDIVLHANELLPETLQLGRLYVVTQPEAIATGKPESIIFLAGDTGCYSAGPGLSQAKHLPAGGGRGERRNYAGFFRGCLYSPEPAGYKGTASLLLCDLGYQPGRQNNGGGQSGDSAVRYGTQHPAD